MRAWLEQRQAGDVPDYTAAEDSTAADDSTAAEAAAEQDDDARLRAEVLAYMKANRVTRRHLGASTEVDLRETVVRQWLKGTWKGNNAAVRNTHSRLAPFCLPPRPTVSSACCVSR